MTSTYQATYYFTTIDSEGWSENLFLSAADINAAATTAFGYIAPRMAASPDNVEMVYGKVSDTMIKGDSKLITDSLGAVTFPAQGTWTANPVGSYLEANTALLIKIVATSTKINRLFLRGLSLDVVTGREFKNPTGFSAVLNGITNFLVTNCQVRTADKPLTKPPVYTYATVNDAFFVRVTARKPGRPFGGPRGRKFAHRTASTLAAKSLTSSAHATEQKPALPRVPRR